MRTTTQTGAKPEIKKQNFNWGTAAFLVIARYAPDLTSDRYCVWLNRFYYMPLIVLAWRSLHSEVGV